MDDGFLQLTRRQQVVALVLVWVVALLLAGRAAGTVVARSAHGRGPMPAIERS